MRAEWWSELSAEQYVRYTRNERFLVIAMSKTSGVTEELCGFMVGQTGPKIRQEFSSAKSRRSFTRLVLSPEFQSTCLVLTSPAIETGNPRLNLTVSFAPISEREGER
jgi:hypothetical protein